MTKINNLLYVSCVCSKSVEHKLFNIDAELVGLQIQKYHRLLLNGFNKNGVKVTALTNHIGLDLLKIDNETEDDIDYEYIIQKRGMLGHTDLLLNSFIKSYKFFQYNPNSILICDVLTLTNSLGAIIAAKLHKKKIIGIITDFPEQLSSSDKLYSFLTWKIINLCSSYIVMTKYMKEKLDIRKKTIVLEGHIDYKISSQPTIQENNSGKKICVYAGTLHEKYGIKKLVESFIKSDLIDTELHIFGNGDCTQWIKQLNCPNIIYHGIWENSRIIEFEKKSHLLINPRPTNEEFTKYSFPSKNLEYMASGTAVLTTALPGMPKEYDNYVYLFSDETIEGMSETLKQVLSNDISDLRKKGREAQSFVLKQKNNIIQTKKIIDALFD